jgi:hypothetical protein
MYSVVQCFHRCQVVQNEMSSITSTSLLLMHWKHYGKPYEICRGTENANWKHISEYCLNYSILVEEVYHAECHATTFQALTNLVLAVFTYMMLLPLIIWLKWWCFFFLQEDKSICSFYAAFLMPVNVEAPLCGENCSNLKAILQLPISGLLIPCAYLFPLLSFLKRSIGLIERQHQQRK